MAPGVRQAIWLILLFVLAFAATWVVQTRRNATSPLTAGDPAGPAPGRPVPFPVGQPLSGSAMLPPPPGKARVALNGAADDAASRETAAREMRARTLDRLEQLLLSTQDRAERLDAVQNLSELALSGDPSGRIMAILQTLRRDSDPEVAAFAGYKAEEISAGPVGR